MNILIFKSKVFYSVVGLALLVLLFLGIVYKSNALSIIPRVPIELTFEEKETLCAILNCDTSTQNKLNALVVRGSVYGDLTMFMARGSSGDDVVRLQHIFNTYRKAGLIVDGKFGTGTEAVVRAFQTDSGLKPDGKVGPHTRAALNAIQKESSSYSLPWEDALSFLHGGQVEGVFQTHSLDVTLILKNGNRIDTVEPNIDAIMTEIERCDFYCSNISIATE